jgi:hypothetical protein
VKILAIGPKLFEEKFRPTGGAIKSIGSEGVESEFSITSEITGFGKAQGIKGTNMGTLRNLVQPSGIGTGTGLGVMTLDGDAVTWKFSYAGKVSASWEKWVCTVTFTTMSEKFRGSIKPSTLWRAKVKQILPSPEPTYFTSGVNNARPSST